MSRPPNDGLPVFLSEALEDDPELDAEALIRLPELLAPVPPPASLERLLEAASQPPLRYAPFFGRLGELWDLREDDVRAVFERAGDPATWPKTPLPGLRLIDVHGGPQAQAMETRLVRFRAGMRFPNHRHPGPESVLILEGSYTDSRGQTYGAGDLHEMQPGTEHSFAIAPHEPCIAATRQVGLEFTGPVMRLLARFAGRK